MSDHMLRRIVTKAVHVQVLYDRIEEFKEMASYNDPITNDDLDRRHGTGRTTSIEDHRVFFLGTLSGLEFALKSWPADDVEPERTAARQRPGMIPDYRTIDTDGYRLRQWCHWEPHFPDGTCIEGAKARCGF